MFLRAQGHIEIIRAQIGDAFFIGIRRMHVVHDEAHEQRIEHMRLREQQRAAIGTGLKAARQGIGQIIERGGVLAWVGGWVGRERAVDFLKAPRGLERGGGGRRALALALAAFRAGGGRKGWGCIHPIILGFNSCVCQVLQAGFLCGHS